LSSGNEWIEELAGEEGACDVVDKEEGAVGFDFWRL